LVRARRATAFRATQVAVTLCIRTQRHVAAHVQIEFAVAVVVEEGCARVKQRSELHARDARLVSDIGKCSVAIVVVENVAPELRDVEIREAVVVVVAPDAAQSVTGPGNVGLVGYVGERPVAVIAIESVAHRNAAIVKVASVHEVNVLPTVPVEIRDTYPGPEFFSIDGDALVALE